MSTSLDLAKISETMLYGQLEGRKSYKFSSLYTKCECKVSVGYSRWGVKPINQSLEQQLYRGGSGPREATE